MDREQLVEAMALAIANVRRAACKLPPLEYLTTVKLDEREALIAEARAALAVAEPVVREWCASEIDSDGHNIAADLIRTGGTP